jgi:hypothetical protein
MRGRMNILIGYDGSEYADRESLHLRAKDHVFIVRLKETVP